MNLLLAVEQLIRLLTLAWFDLRHARFLVPMAMVWAMHLLVLTICANPTFPVWSGLTVPLFRATFGELLLHYPQSLIGLPTSASALGLVVDLLLGPALAGWIVHGSLRTAKGRVPREPWWRGLDRARYLRLFLYGVVTIGLWVTVHAGVIRWVLEAELSSYQNRVLFTYLWGYVPSLLLLPVLFVIPALIEGETSFVAAIRRSVHHMRQLPLLGALIVILPHTLGLPFVYVLNRSAVLANQLRPEVVPWVMAVQALVAIVATFLVLNASSRLWVRRKKAA